MFRGLTQDGKTYLYAKNLQGDIVAIVNEAGTVEVQYQYGPWGQRNRNNSVTGNQELANLNPFTYRGYQYDSETDLYYLQSRYYNPEWKRFINADVYADTDTGIIGSNMFAYCNNNPLSKIDPDGHASQNLYTSGNVAARDFTTEHYNKSLYIRMEISSMIYCVIRNKRVYYSYTPYIVGDPHSCQPLNGVKYIPKDGWKWGEIHTHPNSNSFSSADKKWCWNTDLVLYVATPNKSIRRYYPTRARWYDELVYKNVQLKKVPVIYQNALKNQYRKKWIQHTKTNCGFNCKKKFWPAII